MTRRLHALTHVALVATVLGCLGLAACTLFSNSFTPRAIDTSLVPEGIREAMFASQSGPTITRTYSDVKWYVAEQIEGGWWVASTCRCTESSGSGGSSVSLWSVALFSGDGSGPEDLVVQRSGVYAGVGASGADFQVQDAFRDFGDSLVIYAAGTAWDKRITQVVGKVTDSLTVTATPINGFWIMYSERGTGWLEVTALNASGKRVSTVTP